MRAFKGLAVTVALAALVVSAAAARTVLPSNTVIPVTLDTTLSSETAKVGDTFYAHHSGASGAGFPDQTKFTGKVDSVTKASSTQPGQIGVDFIAAELPSGATVALNGQLTGLDSASVATDPVTGNLIGTTEARKTNWKFIAYGAGAGLILGELLGDKARLGALLGAAAGYLYGRQNEVAVGKNVVVPAGTRFGVLLEQSAVLPSPSVVGGVAVQPQPGTISSQSIIFTNLRPHTIAYRTYVPFRYVMDRVAIPFDYDLSTRTVAVDKGDLLTTFRVGTRILYVNGRPVTMNAPARFLNGSLYVPLSYIQRLTGQPVFYDPMTRVLRIG
jgi:hypothetical protein